MNKIDNSLDETIYLVANGVIMNTKLSTLKNVPYFQKLFDNDKSLCGPKMNFYEIKESSTILSKVFSKANDSSYIYHPKYMDKVEYYFDKTINLQNAKQVDDKNTFFMDHYHNIQADALLDKFTDKKNGTFNKNIKTMSGDNGLGDTFFENSLEGFSGKNMYLTGNPKITFHKQVYKRHTHSLYHIDTTFFYDVPWTYEFKGSYCVKHVKILIPSNISLKELKEFKMTYYINFNNNYTDDQIIESHTLDVIEKLGYVKTTNNYHYIPIISTMDMILPIIVSSDHSRVTIKLESNKYKNSNLKTCLKFYKSYPKGAEKIKFMQLTHETLVIQMLEHQIINNNTFEIDYSSIRGIVWETDRSVEHVKIWNSLIKNEAYYMDKGDFQYLEMEKLKKKPLSNNWGAIFFCEKSFELQQPSGNLSSAESKYKLTFDKKVNGKVWVITDNIIRMTSGESTLIYCESIFDTQVYV
jgi:hypothetical protein